MTICKLNEKFYTSIIRTILSFLTLAKFRLDVLIICKKNICNYSNWHMVYQNNMCSFPADIYIFNNTIK